MELTAEALYGFTTSLLLSRFDNPKPTPAFHKELWELVCRPNEWVAIAAPRGHAKSTAITHSYTLASVLFRQSKYALVVSDTEEQACLFLGDIKLELTENEDLIQLFDIKRVVKDTEKVIIVQFNDGEYFRIDAKGSEQKLRGRKWRGKRPDLIIGDDLENDEIVLNDDRRKKFRDWFFNSLVPMGGDTCKIRIVGTILHMDSLLERLMPPWGGEYTETDGIKFWVNEEYQEEEELPWLSVRYQAHNPDFSLMLWPEKFTRKRLERLRAGYVQQGNPEGYSQEYLNYPIDEENAYFQGDDFLPIKDREEGLEYYVGCDLAISQSDKAAFTVMVVAGINPQGKLKIVDVRRFRGDSLEIVDELFILQQRYEPELFVIEKENIARSIGPFLNQEMHRRGIYLTIDDPVPSQDKMKRAQSIRARMRAGQVEFDHDAHWYHPLYTEMTQFPKSQYKDQVDAIANIGLALDKMVVAATPEELEEEWWEEEESLYLMDQGIDPVTGY